MSNSEHDVLRIEMSPKVYEASFGEPVVFSVRFVNGGDAPLRLPTAIDRFDQCCTTEIEDVPAGARPARIFPMVQFPNTAKYFQLIEPGGHVDVDYDLKDEFPKPGKYRFRLIYQGQSDYKPLIMNEPRHYAATPTVSGWAELELRPAGK